jgi:hypothetical protein
VNRPPSVALLTGLLIRLSSVLMGASIRDRLEKPTDET